MVLAEVADMGDNACGEVGRCEPNSPLGEVLQREKVILFNVVDLVVDPNNPEQQAHEGAICKEALTMTG